MSYTSEYIGARIRESRKARGLTQEKLAERIDIAANYLGQIENGHRGVNLTNLIKIANELNITFDYLMSDLNAEAIADAEDLKRRWSDLFERRSPKERELLLKIAEDLSRDLFDSDNIKE